MSELVIPEDLQVTYEIAKWDVQNKNNPRSEVKMYLIERIALEEAKVAALEAENERLRETLAFARTFSTKKARNAAEKILAQKEQP